MSNALLEAFVALQDWLLAHLLEPVLLTLGLGSYLEMAFDGVEFFLCGVLQITAAYLLLRPLEALRPIEVWPDRKAVRVDVLYSLLDRLGIIPLLVFALLAPLFVSVDGWLRFHDIIPPQLEDLVPALEARPLLSFLIYLILLDFAEYWRHRFSHTLRWRLALPPGCMGSARLYRGQSLYSWRGICTWCARCTSCCTQKKKPFT